MLHHARSWIDRNLRVWGSLYLLLVLALTLAAMYTLAVSIWREPWRDMWEVMPFIEKAMTGKASLFDYWDQYGYSHRPLISRWFWVADMRWFAGSNALLLTVSILMQFVIFASVRAILQRDSSFTSCERCIVLTGVIFCLFNITQVFNFLHTFDVQWFLVTGFVVLSLERILAAAESRNPVWLLVAWVCIFLASLNNFAALVMWPVAILLLLALRFPLAHVAIFFLATVPYFFLYFYQLSDDSPTLTNPLSFQLAGEGPFHMPSPVSWLAPMLAAVLLLPMFWCWIQGLWRRKTYSIVAWMGLSLMLYGYGVSVVTALGRGSFLDNVYALRYQNIVLLFWIGVVLWLAASVRWRNVGLFAGACLLLLVFALRAGWYHDLMLQTGNRSRDAHLALVVGLENQLSAIQATVSRAHLGKDSTYNLQQEAQYLRSIHVGPYADPAWQLPALDVLQAAPVCKTPVANFDVHGDDDSYARLSVDFTEPVPYSVIVWLDDDGAAPGLLIAMRSDDFIERVQQSVSGFTSYAGFARYLPREKPENIYARDGDGWCKLAVSAAAMP